MSIIRTYINQLNRGGNPLDIIWCSIRYGASPNNYRDFGFASLSGAQRKTYVTNRLSRKMIKRFNDPNYIHAFEDKTEFAELFAKYFGRKWTSSASLTRETLESFIHAVGGKFIYKPAGNAQGMGIRVYENVDPDKVWDEIRTQPKAILEEWIPQHELMSKVYSEAINCLRLITVYKDGQTSFLTGGVTWGNGMKIANASACGIVSPVNFKNGVLDKPAADFYGHVYTHHPVTNYPLVGFKVPFWQETIDMLRKAAEVVPQVGYVGWDIAITPSRPVIIEGNTTPGYKYYQIPAHMKNKIGNREIYEQNLL